MNNNKKIKFNILNTNDSENKVFSIQDEKLLQLQISVKKLLNISEELYDELALQNKITENLEESTETITISIKKTEKKLKKTTTMINENESCCIIN